MKKDLNVSGYRNDKLCHVVVNGISQCAVQLIPPFKANQFHVQEEAVNLGGGSKVIVLNVCSCPDEGPQGLCQGHDLGDPLMAKTLIFLHDRISLSTSYFACHMIDRPSVV